jgi:hypothetical protein
MSYLKQLVLYENSQEKLHIELLLLNITTKI